ncbi:MAG: RNA polymerase sigma factor [Clostridia bacterium]|nr:RNA polymerase sigma factor [Clostridia bacterium]
MDNLQLSELAQKAKNGDMSSFEKIYIELSPEIYAIACEITQNKDESHDLVQDCFLAAIENISSLKEPDKIKNWLIRIAANKSRDYLKKKKPSVLTEDQSDIIENIEEDDISVLPEASLETEERIEDINKILQCLSEDKRLCLILRYKFDMSYADIAKELAVTESSVKSKISKAKKEVEKEAEKRTKKGLPLFGIAPFGLVISVVKKSADIAAASFAGSASQTAAFAGISAASQTGIAAVSTAATATTAASTTATAATGVGAKVAAMSVAQKVVAGVAAAGIVTGSAIGTTVVVKNKIESNATATTSHTEEVTTAPDYGFESETVFIPAVAETESLTAELSTSRNFTSAAKQSTTVTQAKEAEKSSAANKTTTKSTTKTNTTTKKQTTTATTRPTTTQKQTTTKKETTTREATTAKATETTAKTTTTTKAATTTTKAATTTTTESASPATVTVTLHTSGSEETIQKTLQFYAGDSISDSVIEQRLLSDFGIDAMSDSISETAESGKSYSVDAFIIS